MSTSRSAPVSVSRAPIARGLVEPMTRRQFMVRTAAFAVSASALGSVLEACGQATRPSATPSATPSPSPVITPQPTFGGTAPVIDPLPTTAAYGPMIEASALAPVAVLSPALRALLNEVAADAAIPVAPTFTDGRRQARLTVTANDPSFASQAYRLEVTPTADGPAVAIRAGDEAGAYYGLLSLARLVVADSGTRWLRAATVTDAPGFARRGAILDPYVLPDVGVTDASRALLLERVRFGARHKLNFLDLLDRTPWPEIVRFCDDHHVELMNGIGYQDRLIVTPRDQVKRQLDELLDAGTRSFSFDWDDMPLTDPVAQAHEQAGILRDLYDYVRARDPSVRVSAVFPPYAHVPGLNLSDNGQLFLAQMPGAFPADVRVFWTGDGGVFSPTVTAAGARAYATAVGHEIGLWDNDMIDFSRDRKPCSGRAADLATVVHTYMGNLDLWSGTNGEFALLTSLFYTWNPASYEPAAAAAAAERILASAS